MYCSNYQVHTEGDEAPSTDYQRHDNTTTTTTTTTCTSSSNTNNDHLFDDPDLSHAEIERQRQQLALHQKPDGSVFLLDVYETPQTYGYCSILFSLVQTLILAVMMWQCGIAPLGVNPMVGPPPDVLDYWGAKNTPKILEDGDYYRLVTPMLLHAGIFHWIGNISVQLETGYQFECEWGSAVWCLVYLTSTVGSSILSVVVMPQSLSVGSSGAVMGIFGAKLSEILVRSCEPNKTLQQKVGHAMRQHQLVLAGGGCILVLVFSFIPFVDWAAHLGGMLTGMTVGLMVFSCHCRSYVGKLMWFVVGLGLTVAGFAVSLDYMYNSGKVEMVEELRDVCGYYQQFDEDYECTCTLTNNQDDGGSGD